MDFPVEAKVHLNNFPSETQVRGILRSHGFVLTEQGRDWVRVKGSFLKLKAAKASLEPLLNSQTKSNFTPSPSSSSGAIPKHYTNSSSDGNRSLRRNKSSHPSPSSPTTYSSWASASSNNRPTSLEYRASPGPEQRASVRLGSESFVVDADVFEYTNRLRKKDIDVILNSHNVNMVTRPVGAIGESCSITLQGKSAKAAVSKLQSLMNDLNTSLRTQEVLLRELDRDGRFLLERIQNSRNIYNSVLVCPKNDRLHLIGPSGESYELKQRLLGRPLDQSGRTGRTGRTPDRISGRRNSSLPPINRKNAERGGGAVTHPSPVGAAGYSPSKYQDDKQEPKRGAAFGLFGGRSQSESRQKNRAERANGYTQDMEKKNLLPKSPTKGLLLMLNPKDIKQTFKNKRR